MRRFLGLGAILAVLAVGLPSAAQAQMTTSGWLGGGATIPTSDFSDYAKTGWMAAGGLNFYPNSGPLWIGGSAFYGTNNHETSGEKTNLFGGLAEVGYRVGDPTAVGIFFFGQLGVMNHQFDDGTSTDGSSKLAYGGGAGVDVPLNDRFAIWFALDYLLRAKEDGENTTIFGLFAGFSAVLGGGN